MNLLHRRLWQASLVLRDTNVGARNNVPSLLPKDLEGAGSRRRRKSPWVLVRPWVGHGTPTSTSPSTRDLRSLDQCGPLLCTRNAALSMKVNNAFSPKSEGHQSLLLAPKESLSLLTREVPKHFVPRSGSVPLEM